MVSAPSYPDYDTYTIHLTENATAQPQGVSTYPILQQAAMSAQDAVFRNVAAGLQCVQRRNFPASTGGLTRPFVDGWDTTLDIIRCCCLSWLLLVFVLITFTTVPSVIFCMLALLHFEKRSCHAMACRVCIPGMHAWTLPGQADK